MIANFNTKRLTVVDWKPELRDPARRSVLEADLKRLLTPALLLYVPPAVQDTSDISHWVDERSKVAQMMLIRAPALIGLLFVSQDGNTAHLGYMLGENTWGQGYASELVAGVVGAAHGPTTLLGGVDVENPASARVLVKNGFARDAALSSNQLDMFTLNLA
jgi:RimJ/RimL family protein N-acetyltransferase